MSVQSTRVIRDYRSSKGRNQCRWGAVQIACRERQRCQCDALICENRVRLALRVNFSVMRHKMKQITQLKSGKVCTGKLHERDLSFARQTCITF